MIRKVLQHLAVFLLFNLVMSVALLQLPPLYGLAVSLFLAWLVLRYYLLRAGSAAEAARREQLRLRPMRGEVLNWMAVAVPVMLLLTWSLGEVYVSLVPVPPDVFNPFGPLMRDPAGRLAITVLAVAVAPLIEELFFRGLIQHGMERRWGAGTGILVAAAVFAIVHLLPWVLPLHFFLGLVFGWVVYTTRSIWSGVVLHSANNAAAILGMGAGEDPLTRPTVWEVGIDADVWQAAALFAVSLVAAAAVAAQLRQSARAAAD